MKSLSYLPVVLLAFLGATAFAGCMSCCGSKAPGGPPAPAAPTAAAAMKPQTMCPVMGAKINKAIFVDYQGQRVYFCCNDCPAQFKADPEKYFAKIAAEGVVLESVQTKCPVTGKDVNKTVFVDYKGRRVYFCCPGCPSEFQKDPETYLKKL
jgi:YHS domain-containing protein